MEVNVKVLSCIVITLALLVSCSTVSEIEGGEDTKVDEVKETEISQEEFEELFGKKDYFSFPEEIIETTTLEPLVLEEEKEEEIIPWEETSDVVEDFVEDLSVPEEIPFVFPIREEETEWFAVPEIEIVKQDEILESAIVDEIPEITSSPTLFPSPQSADKSADNESLQKSEIDVIERQETAIEEELEAEKTEVEIEIATTFDEEIPNIEDILQGRERTEPKRVIITSFFLSHPLVSAICLCIVIFVIVGLIVYRFGKRNATKYGGDNSPEASSEREEENAEPEPSTISDVGVPTIQEESQAMDIIEGEESYKKLVEKNLEQFYSF